MPIISQFIALTVAMLYLVSATVTNKLGHTLLVFRSVLPEGVCGCKFNERVLGSLPELPAPLLVRCAFITEQAVFLWTTAILLLLLALSPLRTDLLQDHSAPAAPAANLTGDPGGTINGSCLPDTPGCFNADKENADHT